MDDHVYTEDEEDADPTSAHGHESNRKTRRMDVETPRELALLAKAKKRRTKSYTKSNKQPMSQLTINKCFKTDTSTWPKHTNVSVVDLFCCIGGFSTGCVSAGHKLVLAVDNDKVAMDAHAANHPSCRHELMELGPDTETRLLGLLREVLPKNEDGSKFLPWHLHGSPPCQKLCSLQRTRYPNASAEERKSFFEEGMTMVLWYLHIVEYCVSNMNLVGWSFEEAPNQQLVERMKVLKRSRTSWFDFELVELWHFGIPQSRKRTIGGSPWLIDRLRHDGKLRERRTIIDVLTPPQNAVSLRSVWSADRNESLDVLDPESGEKINPNNEKRIRLLHELSFTVMGGHSDMYWYDSNMTSIRTLSVEERKRLQTFPPDYRLPTCTRDQVQGVGNAIPPLFAQKFMSHYKPM